jgi:hypothetical protein
VKFSAPLHRDNAVDFSQVFEVPKADQDALKKLGDAFKAACNEVKEQEEAAQQTANNVSALFSVTQNIAQNFLGDKPTAAAPTAAPLTKEKPLNSNKEGVVRPVEFRRIDMTKDLG